MASSSKAAETPRDEPDSAAIGRTLAADLYHLKVICANVEDNASNVTRFFVIGRQPAHAPATTRARSPSLPAMSPCW